MIARAVLRLPVTQREPTVACEECRGRGVIKLWPPGHEERACMARCEQCSGLGRVRS
jgi:DnaJ-class molecular chaperone